MKNIFWDIVKSKISGNSPYIAKVRCKNKKTLDIGCGFADFLKFDPVNFVGVDVNTEAVNFCKKKGFNVKFSSVDKLPFGDASFEAVVSWLVLEHLEPRLAYEMFKEVGRILKPGGEFIVSTEMPTIHIWDAFSHIRPYSPLSIAKILNKKDACDQETFEKIADMKIVGIYYNGVFFRNALLNALSQFVANVTPFNRINYTMIIKKRWKIIFLKK